MCVGVRGGDNKIRSDRLGQDRIERSCEGWVREGQVIEGVRGEDLGSIYYNTFSKYNYIQKLKILNTVLNRLRSPFL